MFVVSAHAADYVWRSGGVIAKYIEEGAEVHVVVLSYGVCGESNDLWNIPGLTAEEVKSIRKRETEKAADILGIKSIEYWDLPDYPIHFTEFEVNRLVRKMREINSDILVSHDKYDIMNPAAWRHPGVATCNAET